MALTPLNEALEQLLATVPPPPAAELVPISRCLNRVLAEDIFASMDVPAFDNSAMDGYAVRIEDLPGELPISQRIPAGTPAAPLEPGTAARIFTGAQIPLGANAVIMQEDALVSGDNIQILGCLSRGAHIRPKGGDIPAGSRVMTSGRILLPQDLGLVASLGIAALPVRKRLKVTVMTTGDELVSPGSARADWQIFNSNATQIAAQLSLLGVEPMVIDVLPDDPRLIGDALEQAAAHSDCIVTSGGVSVGEEDHVRHQIEARGSLKLWKLAIKPGKPLAFGEVRGCPVFGLPGNPVSSWATFGLAVKPWLLKAQGATVPSMRRVGVIAGFEVPRAGTREEFLRVVLDNGRPPTAFKTGDQSSGVLTSTAIADALAIIPAGVTVAEGDCLDAILVSEFLSAYAAG